MSLTPQETKKLESLLARATYPLPENLFYYIARTFPMVAIETVIWRAPRRKHGGLKVLLLRRSPRDPFWPNLWHSPGSILRNRETFHSAFKRISKEFGASFAKTPKFVTVLNTQNSKRGHVVQLVFRCELAGQPKRGKFFPVEKLPRNIVPEHHKLIAIVTRFVQREQKTPKL